MNISTKFSVAIHILIFISLNDNIYCSSTLIAKSVNTNPVVIRRIIKNLKDAGIVEISQGTKGAKLAKISSSVTMLQVFEAINSAPLFSNHIKESNNCEVAISVDEVICNLTNQAQTQMQEVLDNKLLSDLIIEVQNKIKQDS